MKNYRTLGVAGPIVTPFALGTMTFGAERWGTDRRNSRAVFEAYIEAGGNFIDTADIYAGGLAEEMLGEFITETRARDRLVIASKSGWLREAGNPLSGGNSAKNIRMALDGTLSRLGVDYVDVYWIHVWDRATPPEAVLRTLSDAVSAGKILYYGFSNTPAWYVAKVAALATAHGLPLPVGLEYGYSLVDRGIELDVLPMGEHFGLGLVAWGPLQAGLLTGKYDRTATGKADQAVEMPQQGGRNEGEASDGRLNGPNPTGGMPLTTENFDRVDALRAIAAEIGEPMEQIALAWLIGRPGVTSAILGASNAGQVTNNMKALGIDLNDNHRARLDAIGAVEPINPYGLFQLPDEAVFGTSVARRPMRGQ